MSEADARSDRLKREVAERLKKARAFFTLAQREFASISGVGYSTYQKYELGLALPGAEAMEGFARIKINTNWLLTGNGNMLADEENAPPISHDANMLRQEAAPYGAAAPDGFVLVPRYDVLGGMGGGQVIHSEQIVDHLAFRVQWVRSELGTSPDYLVLISAVGDSMEPTLRAHDLLLIDRSVQSVKQDAIYALAVDGELRIKRIQRLMDGSLVVTSDNPAYAAETLAADQAASVNIVGRVVWSGRRM